MAALYVSSSSSSSPLPLSPTTLPTTPLPKKVSYSRTIRGWAKEAKRRISFKAESSSLSSNELTSTFLSAYVLPSTRRVTCMEWRRKAVGEKEVHCWERGRPCMQGHSTHRIIRHVRVDIGHAHTYLVDAGKGAFPQGLEDLKLLDAHAWCSVGIVVLRARTNVKLDTPSTRLSLRRISWVRCNRRK